MAELTAEQQEMINKARNTASQVIEVQDDPKPVAPTRPGTLDEWGPYDDYKIVTTPTGQFGVPKGKILYFIDHQTFSRRENRMLVVKRPRYRKPDEERVTV